MGRGRRRKKRLDICPYGNVLLEHGTSGDNFGCVQCGGGAAAAGDSELSGAAGATGGGDCRLPGDGAAVGLEASARFWRHQLSRIKERAEGKYNPSNDSGPNFIPRRKNDLDSNKN